MFVRSRVCLIEVPFLAYFKMDIKTVMGVFLQMYLKHSTDYIDSKYIWVHGSNSLGFLLLLK